MAAENWQKVTKDLETKVASWRLRRLTMEGRNLVINNVLIGKSLYLAGVSPHPPAVGWALERLVFSFFWRTGAERRRRIIVKMSPSLGGKGVPRPVFVCMSAFSCTFRDVIVSEDLGHLAQEFVFSSWGCSCNG